MGPVVLALVAALHAQAIDVRWRGDARCSQDGFRDSLERYLAGASERRDVAVTVEVRRAGEASWSATLVLATAEGRSARSLRGRSCAEVSDAAAFVTAVVVDPGVLTRPGEAALVPPPADSGQTPESAPSGVPEGTESVGVAGPRGDEILSEETESVGGSRGDEILSEETGSVGGSREDVFMSQETDMNPTASAGELLAPATAPGPRRVVGFVRVAGGLEAFGLPRVGPTAGLAGGVLGRGWRAELTAIYRAPTTEFSAIDPAAGARVRMWAVGARGCGVPRVRGVEFPLCGGVEVGQAIGEGVGFAGARPDRFAWVALVLGPAVAWAPRPWLALWFGADLGLPLLRGTFGATGLGEMFEIAPVSLRAGLGLELRFGRRIRAGAHGSRARREITAGPT